MESGGPAVRYGRNPPYPMPNRPPRTAAAPWSTTMIATLHRTRVALAVTLLVVCLGPARAEGTAEEVYARTLRGTALILTPTGGGTGWVIDVEQGLLLTNEHVVTTHETVAVIFPTYDKDGRPVAERSHYRRNARRYAAEVIDADGRRDLAVIRLKERPPEGV